MAGAVASTGLTAMAQDSNADDDELIVTGSRLVNENVVSASPVVTVDAELFDIRGTTDTIDLVQTLPSVGVGQATAEANGATGTSTLNLRGLGTLRTLVLVDGKRLPPGGPLAGFASDINVIPPQLVERVEIVTGGASAVYGSDAIAGVANFIMRKDFTGLEVDLQYGYNQSSNNSDFWTERLNAAGIEDEGSNWDNETFQASILMGSSLDNGRGNVTGFFNYAKNDGVNQSERDFSQCASFPDGTGLRCLGSNAGPFPTQFVINPALTDPTDPTSAVPLFDVNGNPLLNADGTPQTGGSFSLTQDDQVVPGFQNGFNFAGFNPIRRQVERFNAGFNAYYDVSDAVQVYSDFAFTSSESPQIIAPSAAFGSTINQVNCDNPLLTDQTRALVCGNADINGPFARDVDGDGFAQVQVRRRFVEGGGRTDNRNRTNFRGTAGLRGTLDDNFEWDVFGQYSETRLSRLQTNQVTLNLLQNSLDIVTDPATGLPACRVTVNGTDPACIPFTAAYQNGVPVDPALRSYVDTPTLTTGTGAQTILGATIGGALDDYGIKMPWADEGIGLLLGVEYRKDELFQQADGTASSGNLVGSGGATTPADGSTSLYEIYAETNIPVISGMTGIEQLNLNAAIRYSDYSSQNNLDNTTGGNFDATTYALGVSWVPTDDLRFRGQYQRAIRAPNVNELFTPQNTNLTNLSDPCSGFPGSDTPPTATPEQCANTGLNPAQFGFVPPDSGQLNTLTGGNPNLSPEISDTFTLGAIYQPSQVPGLLLSVDYYDITIEDAIGTIPTATTLNQCLTTGDAGFCDLIQRGPDGSLTFFPRELSFITATSQNVASLGTTGIDFQAQYRTDIGDFGDLTFDYNSTWQLSQENIDIPGGGEYDCVGFYASSCGFPVYDYRHNFVTSWATPIEGVRASVIWRYLSAVDQVGTVNNGIGQDGSITSLVEDGGDSIDERLSSRSYFDFATQWQVNDTLNLRAGVNNVFDKNPPIVINVLGPAVDNEANTVRGQYDTAGRFLFVGATMNF
ncbi:MAG: TonB-dependent receptor [Litorimonas sp.]